MNSELFESGDAILSLHGLSSLDPMTLLYKLPILISCVKHDYEFQFWRTKWTQLRETATYMMFYYYRMLLANLPSQTARSLALCQDKKLL